MTQPSNRRFVMEDRLPLESADLAVGSVTNDQLAADSVTSDKILNGTIVNADINASAAIAPSKVAGTAVTQADTGTVTSTMIANGTIVDADVNASAAIAATKVQGTLPTGGTTGQILAKNSGTNYDTTWIDNFAPNVELYVKNQSGSAMTKGQVVYIAGVDNAGDTPRVALADADAEATSSKTIGRLKQDLADGAFGYVVTEGIIEGLNTAAATAGQSIWLSGTAGGVVYGAPPAKPAHSVYLGVVIRAQTNNGKVYVKVQNGYELEELHNVNINSGTLATGQALTYDSSSSMWVNSTPASTLNDLTDVTINGGTLAGGQVIKYDAGTTQWVNGAAAGGVTASATAPNLSTSAAGDAWFDTNDGTLYVCYVDVDSTKQWVQVKANSALEATILGRLSALEGQAVAFGNLSPNYIINGGFDINQRNFSSTTSNAYGFDRWVCYRGGGTVTYSAQTFTLGSAPVSGYEAANYARIVSTGQSATSDYSIFTQPIEDVRTLAGQTITVSFWARAASGTPKVALELQQSFGSGGTPSSVVNSYGGQVTLTTTWARYSLTTSVPSIAGKTLGTTANTSSLGIALWTSGGTDYNSRTGSLGIQNNTIDFWGVQVERGSQATAFRRNAPSIQAELAACQRYYWRRYADVSYGYFGSGRAPQTTLGYVVIQHPVPMRVAPTALDWSGNLSYYYVASTTAVTPTSIAADQISTQMASLAIGTSSGLTAGGGLVLFAQSASSAYIGFSAEL